jgi:type I restriction enzyme S subunit
MSERILPSGWVWTTFEDCADVITGTTPSKKDPTNYGDYLPFVKPPELKDCEISEAADNLSEKGAKFARVLPPHSVLVSCIGNLGKTGINRIPIAFNQQINAIIFPNGIEPKYGFYYCQTAAVKDYLYKIASATTVTIVNKSKFQTTPFPLPPLPEQHRIVAEIEKQLTRLDAGVAALRRAQANLRRYKATVLKAACEGRLVPQDPADEPAATLLQRILAERRQRWEAEQIVRGKDPKKLKYKEPASPDTSELPELPERWVWATVEQIGATGEQPVLTGPFGSNLGRSDFIASGVPVLTIGCLTEQGLSLDKASYISDAKASELKRYRVKSGDLLFSRMATVGRADMVTTKFEGAIINYHLMRLRLAEDVINPIFFISYVRGAETVVDYVREVNHGATRDGINTRQLLALPVALPPLAEQQRIVAEVERRLSVVEELDAAVEANLKRAGRLRQAVLKRAFEGRLVPQDPNDEPACLLLERIRAAREGAGGKNNRKSSRQQKRRRGEVSDKQLRLL